MRKTLKFLIFIALIILPIKVNASYINIGLNCPTGANAGQTISCSITTSNSGDIGSVMILYNFSGGVSYSSFTASGSFGLLNPKTTGVQIGQPGGSLTASGNLGTLVVKIPSTASPGTTVTVGLTGIQASTTSYEDITAGSVSRNININSTNNNLSSLSISGATINFNPNTLSYSVNLNAATTTISAVAADSKATISGIGAKNLKEGKNIFYVTVTAQSGAQKTYTIIITRPITVQPTPTPNPTPSPTPQQPTQPESEETQQEDEALPELPLGGLHEIEAPASQEKDKNNKLKSLAIKQIPFLFNPSISEYEIHVYFDVELIDIMAEPQSDKAKIDGNNKHSLSIGRNLIKITVTSEDEKTRIYEIVVIRDKEEKIIEKNKLKDINIEGYDIKFDSNKNVYTIKTSKDSLNINVTLENDASSYVIKGNNNLIDGSIIKIKVTDEDGNLNTYEIKILKTEDDKKLNISLIITIISIIFGISGFSTAIYFIIKNKKQLPTN